jgi:hypothetical protein
LAAAKPEQVVATLVIMFLVFLPLFAFGALSEVMGEKALFRTFFVKPVKIPAQLNRHGETSFA